MVVVYLELECSLNACFSHVIEGLVQFLQMSSSRDQGVAVIR